LIFYVTLRLVLGAIVGALPAPRTEREPLRWIGFSEDDAKRVAGGAKYQAAKPLSQRVEDNTFHRCGQEIVAKHSQNIVDKLTVLD